MTTALVLGGGGPVGIAWEAGLLAGLAEAGVDLSDADRIVGTSAGSVVGARLALGHTPADLVAATGEIGEGPQEAPPVDGEALLALGVAMFEALTGGRAHDEIVADVGHLALGADTIEEETFVALVGAGLGSAWPERDYVCTAYDAASGAFRAWDAAAGAPLDRAVASSCSVPGIFPPVTIEGTRYMDGGVLSGTNAGLAAGADRVVIVSVMSRAIPAAEAFLRGPLDQEAAGLRAAGAAVEVLELDDEAVAAAGGNLMDFTASTVRAVGAAGLDQGRREADRIGGLWSAR